MKKRITRMLSMVTALMMMLGSFSFAADDFGAGAVADKDTFTLEEMLTYAIQDEYLARAEYNAIMKEFGVQNPFVNIEKAENVHISLLEPLFKEYSIELPKDEAYKYVIVPDTLKEAFQTGIDAEIANIGIYEKFLEQKDLPDDVRAVFERLKAASENHLAAFERGLERADNNGNNNRAMKSNSGFGKGTGNRFRTDNARQSGQCQL